MTSDTEKRAALDEHWQASDRGDTEAEHAIYGADAILDYPQSGERYRGRDAIAAQRSTHPANRHFSVLRIVGGEDLWVSECIITYDEVPSYSVSIMEFASEHVVHETRTSLILSVHRSGEWPSPSRCRAGTSLEPDRPTLSRCRRDVLAQ
jgi:hypothetical protein